MKSERMSSLIGRNQRWLGSGLRTILKKCGGLIFLLAIGNWSAARAEKATLQWDPNTESDLAGYSLYSSTKSLLSVSTQTASLDHIVTKLRMGTSIQISTSTEITVSFPTDTTIYYRLTAHDTWYNESGFNVDYSSNPTEVVMFLKNCDLNGDGSINAVDLSMMINMILGTSQMNFAADLNNDGFIDSLDTSIMINRILGN